MGADPLRSLFFKYRRKKNLSLRGFAPGIEYSFFRRGVTRTPNTGHVSQHNHDEYGSSFRADEYDPGRTSYRQDGPQYHHRDGRHDIEVAPTPPIRFPVPRGLSASHRPLVDSDIAHETSGGIDIQALFDPNPDAVRSIAEICKHFEAMKDYAESVMAGETAQAMMEARQIEEALATINRFFPAGMDAGFSEPSQPGRYDAPLGAEAEQSPMAEFIAGPLEQDSAANTVGPDDVPSDLAALANDVQEIAQNEFAAAAHQFDEVQSKMSLEQLVEYEMQQVDPFATMGAYGMMGMPMDSFGPMPPGLGPM